MLLVIVNAVLALLGTVLTNPLFDLAVFGTVILFGLSKVPKLTWAVTAWAYWSGVLVQLLNDVKADPLAFVVLAFVVSVNITVGLIAVSAYFVVRKLNIKL